MPWGSPCIVAQAKSNLTDKNQEHLKQNLEKPNEHNDAIVQWKTNQSMHIKNLEQLTLNPSFQWGWILTSLLCYVILHWTMLATLFMRIFHFLWCRNNRRRLVTVCNLQNLSQLQEKDMFLWKWGHEPVLLVWDTFTVQN